MLRRAVLGLAALLLVARPLVLGEDPGLISRLSTASGLLLTVLWLLAAVGWAAWRAWSTQAFTGSWLVEAGLSLTVVGVFLSSITAAYRHPALLIAWEWLVDLAILLVIRQMTRSQEERRGFVAILLASAVSLSAYAIYQAAVELPRQQLLLAQPEHLQQELARNGIYVDPADPEFSFWQKRMEMNHVFGTYAHPNSFAGYLVLLLPAAFWAAIRSWRAERRGWRPYAVTACAVLLAVALWLTHSRGGILGGLLAGAGIMAVQFRHRLSVRPRWIAVGIGIAALGLVAWSLVPGGSSSLGKAWRSLLLRGDYWAATWGMIRDHPLLGVGPGSFGSYYPRYQLPTAFEQIQDPHNWILEIWATSGLLTTIALLASLAAFGRILAQSGVAAADPAPLAGSLWKLPHWEFVLGGVAGLLLALVLRAGDLSADEIKQEGLVSAVRAGIWFAAFCVLYPVPWSERSLQWALGTGVAALLLNLLVSGGIALPSVAQFLWAGVALALSGTLVVQGQLTRARASIPLAVVTGLGLAYFFLVFLPVSTASGLIQEARLHYGDQEGLPGWRNAVQNRQPLAAAPYLKKYILEPLEAAAREDPGDVTPRLELAHWYGELARTLSDSEPLYTRAIEHAQLAQKLDPENKEVYLAEYRLALARAQRGGPESRASFAKAARALEAAVLRDPLNARLRFQLAEVLFLAGDAAKGRMVASEARELDRQAPIPERELSDSQRKQILTWLEPSAAP